MNLLRTSLFFALLLTMLWVFGLMLAQQKRKLDPGPPQQRNVYDVLDEGGDIPRVPGHLGEALDALEQDEVVRSAMPGRLYDVYMHYKRDEWQRFLGAVTDWERERYMDILP